MASPPGIPNPESADLTTLPPREIICYLAASSPNRHTNADLGLRISSIFVILIASTAATALPVVAARSRRVRGGGRVAKWAGMFVRNFGAGVIVATGFVHLLNPAYGAIGPDSCVGMTGGWSLYGWPGALAMAGATGVWVMDLAAKRYVEKRYCVCGLEGEEDGADGRLDERTERRRKGGGGRRGAEGDVGAASADESAVDVEAGSVRSSSSSRDRSSARKERLATVAFKQQLAAFLVLEFGILMHSVIIGMAMGAAGADEFPILYVVLLFHQSFEGLGIGARLSAIPMPARPGRWLPWALCGGYGVTTPVGIAVGLGLRHGYDAGGFAAQAVAGVLDAVSAGILLYNGLVELLARDFIFHPERTDDDWELAFMVGSVLVGAGIMALLGKWA